MINIVFFGSFQHYSALILQALLTRDQGLVVSGVVTTPPIPMGRKKILTKNPVQVLAEANNIPVFVPDSLIARSPDSLIAKPPDLFMTAGYGKIFPKSWLEYPKHGSLNLHFSLLPKYRGANPAEWAIMCGETETGITLMEMNQGLDTGAIINQAAIPIDPTDSRETLYQKLYLLGAEKLPDWLSELCRHKDFSTQGSEGSRVEKNNYVEQPSQSTTPYAALLKRDDGFIPWSTILRLRSGQALTIEDFPGKHLQTALKYTEKNLIFQRAAGPRLRESSTAKMQIFEEFLLRLPRALAGYPSVWTLVQTTSGEKRMKILSFEPFLVQIEGKTPTHFTQIKNMIQSPA